MVASVAALSIVAGGSQFKTHELWSRKSNMFVKTSSLEIRSISNHLPTNRSFSVTAEYRDGGRGGSDFLAGFILGGAVFGVLAYTLAPKISKAVRNENENGFRRSKQPTYYDDDNGLEKTRQTLNAKIGQLSSAIDTISSRLKAKVLMKPEIEDVKGTTGNSSVDEFQPYI